jgi:O-antigen/teichoic acid export membrane protein
MKKLLNLLKKDNIQVLLGNMGASFFGLLNFLLMVRMTTTDDFGRIVIFMSIAGLADLIRTGFVRQGLVRHWISANLKEVRSLAGSAWVLHLAIAVAIVALLQVVQLIPQAHQQVHVHTFLQYYPLLLIGVVPHQMMSWIAQARKKYIAMNAYRLLANVLIFVLLAVQYGGELLTTEEVILLIVISHLAVSVFSLISADSVHEVIHMKPGQVLSLFQFGKYSLSTLAGSNLLKSTDTLLIGLLINSESAAIYAIPFKVIELLEIPLRGFVMTSFHRLTLLFNEGNTQTYAAHFKKSVTRLTLVFLPIILFCLIFPSVVVRLLSGATYTESIHVLQVLSIAMLLLPLDKYAGMALDSINRPQDNAMKVWLMVIINFVGDLVVILLEGPLWMIAAITIANVAFGVVYGILRNLMLVHSKPYGLKPASHI